MSDDATRRRAAKAEDGRSDRDPHTRPVGNTPPGDGAQESPPVVEPAGNERVKSSQVEAGAGAGRADHQTRSRAARDEEMRHIGGRAGDLIHAQIEGHTHATPERCAVWGCERPSAASVIDTDNTGRARPLYLCDPHLDDWYDAEIEAENG